jgi:NADH-quinone oxidoreductase subunit A
MTPLAAYLLLFLAVGVGFIFVHLVAGKFIRPNKPDPEKGTVYECGEPTVGTAWVQFDLRFYVVALLFVIFDVEVAFFFPWAEVFGKANAIANLEEPPKKNAAWYQDYARKVLDLAAPATSSDQQQRDVRDLNALLTLTDTELEARLERQKALNEKARRIRDQLKAKEKPKEVMTPAEAIEAAREGPLGAGQVRRTRNDAWTLAWLALGEVLVFFGVLLVGFAYLWRRGDLQWVRSTAAERPEPMPPPEPVISAPAAPRQTAGAGSH